MGRRLRGLDGGSVRRSFRDRLAAHTFEEEVRCRYFFFAFFFGFVAAAFFAAGFFAFGIPLGINRFVVVLILSLTTKSITFIC